MKHLSPITIFSVLLICCGVFFFQNCSKQQQDDVKSVNVNVSKINWDYSSGTVAPDYQYTVAYSIDLLANSLSIAVTQGAQAGGLPTPVNRTLTLTETGNIKSLINKMFYGACATGNMPVGGGRSYVSLFSVSATTPDMKVYKSDCTGVTDADSYQAMGGITNLTDYLKTL